MRDIMKRLEEEGIVEVDMLRLPNEEQLRKGVAITECLQPIPCNPCKEVCPTNAIKMDDINDPPLIDYDKCIGCSLCVE
ncbi:MAG: 4Fe-4S binding protein, partial [Thermoplasmata archaeon]|nr:4Fe-4S binding protein [Thermoplasmata archaeon]